MLLFPRLVGIFKKLDCLIDQTDAHMTLILGGILFWVIFSVLGPIYDLITKVQV